ncbi:FUSC family protein [Demequina flava]|uniref:FUSC family protein n=1 Tax=Demequina flava TaxID=1095025 RepID=UPI000783053A|nr:FUSC family protein [Demequina flava]
MSRQPHRNRRAEYARGAGRTVKSLGQFHGTAGPRWPMGLQAGMAYVIPVLLGAAIGKDHLGLLAASGAFTILHVPWLPARERIKVLPLVSVVLLICTALGTATSACPIVNTALLTLLAIGVGALYLAFHMGPPGPIFAVMTFGLGSHATAPVDGVRPMEPGTVIASIAVGCLISCAIAAAPLVRKNQRRVKARSLRQIQPGPDFDREARELIMRITIVAVVGSAISMTFVDPERVYWTVGAGIGVVGMRAARGEAARRGLHRIVGTLLGIGLFAVLVQVHWTTVALAFILGSLQFATQVVIVRNYAAGLVFITPLALLIVTTSTGAATLPTVTERVYDTIVGALLGAATGLLHKHRPVSPAPPTTAD